MRHLIIAGSGTMGASMAQIFAGCDYKVTVYDIKAEALTAARERIARGVETLKESGEMDAAYAQRTLNNIEYTSNMECFRQGEAVIENIVENLEIKRRFYAEISRLTPDETVIASNTSGLSINAMAEAVRLPERFIGMHWFNPAHLIPLIEVIKGEHTSHETMETVYQIAEQLGKKPIYVSRDALGFIANRIQLAILRECIHIKEEGIGDFKDIDRCMKYGLGFRYACLGPFEVCDHGGLDTFYHIASYLYEDLASNKSPDGTLLQTLFDSAEYGVKSGKGFYDYSDGLDREAVDIRDQMYIEMAKHNITSISEPYEKKL